MRRGLIAATVVVLAAGGWLAAQGGRRASPAGSSATQVGGKYTTPPGADEPQYQGGKWIEITYGRPIRRGRDLWGSGAEYGKKPGEYSLFIDLKPNNWTLIVSNWAAKARYTDPDKGALWGAFDYTPDKDVVRAPMKLETLPHSIDQLTWNFVDMTDAGGAIAIVWDKTMASVPFKVGM